MIKTWLYTRVLPAMYFNDVFDNIHNGLHSLQGRLIFVLLVFGAVMIVWSGYLYSGGEDSKRKGKAIWLRVAGGVGFALVATLVISYIQQVMGGGF